jgi:F0F1-type ATP synthase membrane subunit c/vacuolar-type H+-ATPase subunit K
VDDDPAHSDPGWPSFNILLLMMVPVVGIRLAKGRLAGDFLTRTRLVFISFSSALVLFGVVITFHKVPGGSVMPWLAILVAIAAASVLFTGVAMSKSLDCSSPGKLLESWRTRFFLVIAFNEAVALLAFAFVFIGGPKWIYDAGGAFTLFRLWTVAAPTRGALARDQARLDAAGCNLSLVGLMLGIAPGDDA